MKVVKHLAIISLLAISSSSYSVIIKNNEVFEVDSFQPDVY